jgi:hypothetical protein
LGNSYREKQLAALKRNWTNQCNTIGGEVCSSIDTEEARAEFDSAVHDMYFSGAILAADTIAGGYGIYRALTKASRLLRETDLRELTSALKAVNTRARGGLITAEDQLAALESVTAKIRPKLPRDMQELLDKELASARGRTPPKRSVATIPKEQLKQDLEEILSSKGLPKADAQKFVERVLAREIEDPEGVIQILKSLNPERLKSANADTVIPFTIKQMARFHGSAGINPIKAAETLNTWSDMELSGLARSYYEANAATEKAGDMASKIAALRKVFREQEIPEDLSEQLMKCTLMR